MIHHLHDDLATRDRRLSRELGGGQRIREGFERVRGEMEGAAREMRRETLDGNGPVPAGAPGFARPEQVDWVFWGAVVQDFEEVAKDRPKELSKAIQQGIPTVIR